MHVAVDGYTGARTGAGLMIATAVHVALGAALLSLGVVEIPLPETGPIRIRNVPNPPQPIEKVEPVIRDDRIDPVIKAPILDIDIDLQRLVDTAPRGSDVVSDLPPPDRGPIALPPTPPEPVFATARLDPRFAARFQPPYPPASERQAEEGTVLVRVRVGTNGRVLSAELKASSGHRRLDAAAIEHARRAWRFVPATRDGVAVESWREIPVRFELRNG